MSLKVEIDPNSGFCGGVVRAIKKAEAYLDDRETTWQRKYEIEQTPKLYSLGSIVHNEAELNRLAEKGLFSIDVADLFGDKVFRKNRRVDSEEQDHAEAVLIRAHGEPPVTYKRIKELGLNLIDCTCPVVLALQRKIKEAYVRLHENGNQGQIIIFGKVAHAEVLGLMGQINGDAILIDSLETLKDEIASRAIKLSKAVEIFSQTTKNPDDYERVCKFLLQAMSRYMALSEKELLTRGLFKKNNTICSEVSLRYECLRKFAASQDIIIFVAGSSSSNGKILCDLCRTVNKRTYSISAIEQIDWKWFRDNDKVGICGATSTPKWLLEKVANKILQAHIQMLPLG